MLNRNSMQYPAAGTNGTGIVSGPGGSSNPPTETPPIVDPTWGMVQAQTQLAYNKADADLYKKENERIIEVQKRVELASIEVQKDKKKAEIQKNSYIERACIDQKKRLEKDQTSAYLFENDEGQLMEMLASGDQKVKGKITYVHDIDCRKHFYVKKKQRHYLYHVFWRENEEGFFFHESVTNRKLLEVFQNYGVELILPKRRLKDVLIELRSYITKKGNRQSATEIPLHRGWNRMKDKGFVYCSKESLCITSLREKGVLV